MDLRPGLPELAQERDFLAGVVRFPVRLRKECERRVKWQETPILDAAQPKERT